MVIVQISKYFRELFKTLPNEQQIKINSFIRHVQKYGLANLEGKNKSSDDVPTDDPNWLAKVQYAHQYQLWHYHIGIPKYDDNTKPFGKRTSQYILHYIYNEDDNFIKLVDFSSHPPFKLPESETME